MKVIAVSTILNEADIVAKTIDHLYGNGVDEIHVALGPSTDGTREILERYPVKVFDDHDDYHFQPAWVNKLAEQACEPGDWCLPFDADEFWYATARCTIREALTALPDEVRKLHVRAFQHRDWDYCEVVYRSLGKVAFRWEPGAQITNGNHDVSLPSRGLVGVLDLRELQFRSFEHLVRKCHERVDRIDPSLPLTDGVHQRELAALDMDALRARWEQMQSVEVVFDPVPSP